MEIISFGTNWNNKLHGKYFSTLRLNNKLNIGDKLEIRLSGKKFSYGSVIEKTEMELGQITNAVAYLDCGYDAKHCKMLLKEMYKNKPINWKTQKICRYIIQHSRQLSLV